MSVPARREIRRGYRLPDRLRRNTPQALERALGPARGSGLLPRLPFGSDLTEEELVLAADLRGLRGAWKARRGLLAGRGALRKLLSPPPEAARSLRRLDLERPRGVRERGLRLAVLYALVRGGSI